MRRRWTVVLKDTGDEPREAGLGSPFSFGMKPIGVEARLHWESCLVRWSVEMGPAASCGGGASSGLGRDGSSNGIR